MSRFQVLFSLVFGVSILATSAPAASEAKDLSAQLDENARLAVVGDRISLSVGGRETWHQSMGGDLPEGKTTIATYQLSDGLTAVRITISGPAGNLYEWVAVRKPGGRRLAKVWSGSVVMSGDPGERTGWGVEFEDLTGDGHPEIVVGRRFDPAKICGLKKTSLLFRQVYDPGSRKLRSVLASRGLHPTGDLSGTVSTENGASPLLRAISPLATSRMAGDRGDPLLLSPPHALVDGNPETAWVAHQSNGAGEFVTFAAATRSYGLTRIGIRSMPAGSKRNAFDRPKSILLVTEKSIQRLVFPDDAGGEDTVWFDLPEPTRTGCLSLVLEKSVRPSPGKQLAIAELTTMTEVDSKGGLEKLAADLSSQERGEQAATMLRRIGEAAVGPVRGAWKKLDLRGKRRATRVLSEAAADSSVDLLAEAAVDSDEILARNALVGLNRSGDAGANAVITYLRSEVESQSGNAAKILSRLKARIALEGLMSIAGEGSREKRKLTREMIGRSLDLSQDRPEQIWTAIERAEEKGEEGRDRMIELLRAAAGSEPIAPRIIKLSSSLLGSARDFPSRFKLVEVLAGTKHPDAAETLLVASTDDDEAIRELATRALAQHSKASGVTEAIVRSLDDPEIQVRLAAIWALAKAGLESSAGQELRALALSDPWPVVRIQVVQQAARLGDEHVVPVLEGALKDPSRRVRLEATRATAGVSTTALSAQLEGMLADPEEDLEILKVAAIAVGARCQASAVPVLVPLLKRGAEPLADQEEREAAVAAAKAIGAIGGAESLGLLKKARQRSNPMTDKAIDSAIETLGQKCSNTIETNPNEEDK